MTQNHNYLTTNQGAPVGDNQNSRTAGQHGPTLLEDYHLLEKIAHFDRERIPERVVHARGAGAFGTFQVEQAMNRYTKAAFLGEAGKETPVSSAFRPLSMGRVLRKRHVIREASRSNFIQKKVITI